MTITKDLKTISKELMKLVMKKTGFNEKKVRNMLNRTYKQGKITRVEKGIYVGA
jgi:DNA-binding transcriptional regulator PaaX